ncbi:hypothetical protein [Streptomyces pristinaespiralis]|uniref:hypothetical protein n=1 Tax=Streptomyces pristinaespiralis TaxID=38300 RepID=UPI0033CE4435
MPSANHVLCGLAANAALPAELLDRLIADADVAADLARRPEAAAANPSLPLAVMSDLVP